MRYKAPRGTNDILPGESWRWQALEQRFREACNLAGFAEIRTPTFEETALFTRSIGEVTDIVSKEMYTFADRSGRELTLRPEGTASVARAWVEHNLGAAGLPTKLFYISSIFRYERPQAGRYREHQQFGVEAIGADDPELDAEVISLAWRFLNAAGAAPLILKINSIGIPSSRAPYLDALKASVGPYIADLCPSCQTRFEKNPLRMLDCKEPKCRQLTVDVPKITDHLDDESAAHHERLKAALSALDIPYEQDDRLVRGFDYATRTAFEIQAPDALGAQNTVCGGVRYDNLIEEVGGPPAPSVGFGMGTERLLLLLEDRGAQIGTPPTPEVFVVRVGNSAQVPGLVIADDLRRLGVPCDLDYGGRSMKAQMKKAGKQGARIAVILGDDEISAGQVSIRDMQAQQQWRMPIVGCAEMIQDYIATSGADKG